jgi:hypothetical protein
MIMVSETLRIAPLENVELLEWIKVIQAKSQGGRVLEGNALWPICMTNDVVRDSRLSGLLAVRGVVPDPVEDDGPVIGKFRNPGERGTAEFGVQLLRGVLSGVDPVKP